jgi:hypothetical protein
MESCPIDNLIFELKYWIENLLQTLIDLMIW